MIYVIFKFILILIYSLILNIFNTSIIDKSLTVDEQIRFVDSEVNVKNLGLLERHALAHYVGFYKRFGQYFDEIFGNEDFLSCEENNHCLWYRIDFGDIQIVFFGLSKAEIEDGKLVITGYSLNDRDVYYVVRYKSDNYNNVIKKGKILFNDNVYCIGDRVLQYQIGEYGGNKRLPELGYHLNKLMDDDRLIVYSLLNEFENVCQINVGLLLYKMDSPYYYIIIKKDQILKFLSEDSNYEVPFSIDIINY